MSIVVLDEANPVARIAHRCSSCSRVIEPGETYNRQRNIGDDGPYVWKECAHCRLVSNNIWTRDPDASWYHDDGLDLFTYLSDYFPETYAQFRHGWTGVALDDVVLPFPAVQEASNAHRE